MLQGKVIDADGHLLEPPDLWQNYLESKYKDRAIRMEKDQQGVEYLVADGRPLAFSWGFGANVAGIGQPLQELWKPGKFSFFDGPESAYEAGARLRYMDEVGVDVAVLYPSTELIWEGEVKDVELAAAYCRAYNTWAVEFCSADPRRLIPIAHISLLDIQEGVKEAKRVAKLGMKGVFIRPAPPNKVPFWDRVYDPFWAVLQELALPLGLHVGVSENYLGHDWVKTESTIGDTLHPYRLCVPFVADLQAAFASLFQGAVFDRFPRLRLFLLETGAGWIAHAMERWDSKYKKVGYKAGLKLLPSEYFRRQCWISFDPDETTVPFMAKMYGADRFVWASDFPHWDASLHAVQETKEAIASLPKDDQQKILGDNVAQAYRLS